MGAEIVEEVARAEDVLLGTHGFAEGARLVELLVTATGYQGKGVWPSGEVFSFTSTGDIDEIERWAIEFLVDNFARGRSV